jgi:hypothetical protein
MTMTRLTSKDIDQINAMLDEGWSLIGPSWGIDHWYMQKGRPGAGGETIKVHAVVAGKVSRELEQISRWRMNYARPAFAAAYRAESANRATLGAN